MNSAASYGPEMGWKCLACEIVLLVSSVGPVVKSYDWQVLAVCSNQLPGMFTGDTRPDTVDVLPRFVEPKEILIPSASSPPKTSSSILSMHFCR